MADIDIITYVHKTEDYANLMRRSCEIFASKENTFHWKCIKSNIDQKPIKDWETINVSNSEEYGLRGSTCHAIALNKALTYAKSDYIIVADADIAILYPEWDKQVIHILHDIGIQFYGFEPPCESRRGNQSFPCVFFMAFKRKILDDLQLDFKPDVDENEKCKRYQIDTPEKSHIFNKHIGDSVKCDTGWKIPIIAKKYSSAVIPYMGQRITSNISYTRILPYKNKEQERICMQNPTHMAEWHLKNKLFGTHKQAARVHPLNKGTGKIWKDRIDVYTQKEFGVIL